MFKGLGNMADMIKQAQDMQKKLTDSQQVLENITVQGSAGAGMVTVEMNAKGTVSSIKIDPTLLKPEEQDILQDLIVTAMNDAKQKAETASNAEMEKITGGLSLPAGFKLPF